MEIQEAIDQGTEILETAGVPSAKLDAQLIMAHLLNVKREWLHAHSSDMAGLDTLNDYELLINKRAARVPLAYLTQERDFYGLLLYVDERVLIPRPETEVIVEYIIEKTVKKEKIIDVGTGSGAIALALKKNMPKSEIHASDISASALEVAKKNAEKHNLDIEFHESNLLSTIKGKFDIIIANLPYVSHEKPVDDETLNEPVEALYASDAGLEYIKLLIMQAVDHLEPGALLVLECETEQIALIKEFAKDKYSTEFDDIYMIVLKYIG